MPYTSQPYASLKGALCLLLLCVMIWQQWTTFTKHQVKFLAPINYVKTTYGNDDISYYSARLNDLKKMFPGQTCLTYVSETVVPNAGTRELHFAIAQYNLAPNLLFRNNIIRDSLIYDSGASPVTFSSIVCDTVIYNLYSSIYLDTNNNYYLKNGWHTVKDLNNGLIVLAK